MLDQADATEARPSDRPVILFDGVCNLCNGLVNFIIDRDPCARIRFASLQAEPGQSLLRCHGLSTTQFDTLLLIEDGAVHLRSTAVLRIFRLLRWPWPLLYGCILVPRILRDFVYDRIARHRYPWFGRRESCRVPGPELGERFL
ncbi:MAG: thiol-disulfide oxidoreductase DCC family protein [Planctomycetota bacterium]